MWWGVACLKIWFSGLVFVVLFRGRLGEEFRLLGRIKWGGGEGFELLRAIWIGGTWEYVKIREIILYWP